jgi:hypothetical protein
MDDNGNQYFVDPAQELSDATDCGWARYNCIVSFADGLVSSGHRVYIDCKFKGCRRYTTLHRPSSFTTPMYFLIGLAWGRGEWRRLMQRLQTYVREEYRLMVLQETASHYLRKSPLYGDEITLRMP